MEFYGLFWLLFSQYYLYAHLFMILPGDCTVKGVGLWLLAC